MELVLFPWASLSGGMLDTFGQILGTSVLPAASLPQFSHLELSRSAGWAGHPELARPALSGNRVESHMPSASLLASEPRGEPCAAGHQGGAALS